MSFLYYCLIFILLASLMPDAQGKYFLYSLFENILAFLSFFCPCVVFFLILTFFMLLYIARYFLSQELLMSHFGLTISTLSQQMISNQSILISHQLHNMLKKRSSENQSILFLQQFWEITSSCEKTTKLQGPSLFDNLLNHFF